MPPVTPHAEDALPCDGLEALSKRFTSRLPASQDGKLQLTLPDEGDTEQHGSMPHQVDTLRTLPLWASLWPSLVASPVAIVRPSPRRCLWHLRHSLPLLLLLRRLLRCTRSAHRSGWRDPR